MFEASDNVLLQCIIEISDSLDNRMTTKMAAGCTRSLLLMPGRGQSQTTITTSLLPRLIAFLSEPSDVEGLDESRSMIAQALVTFASTATTPKQQPGIFALVIVTLLARASAEGEATHRETAARLLELAGNNAVAFRAVVTRLDTEQKGFMERVIRDGQGPQRISRVGDAEEKEPTIALRMDF